MIIICITYLFADSYNETEHHYRSISGIMTQNRMAAHFIGNLANFALWAIYDSFIEFFVLPRLRHLNLVVYVMGVGVLAYDLDQAHVMHFVFLVLYVAALSLLNVLIALHWRAIRMWVLAQVSVAKGFVFVTVFWSRWSNIHTALELAWVFVTYMTICAATYFIDRPRYTIVPDTYHEEIDPL